ncbi:energy-coupling factor transporter transmembrane component T family protein [Salininema proteolyticum]|uniref:Energy-coupling factor transporter transmembrane component T family protein n=1 Tax=Salininema proteolyticum TaxID=1607685 RepID=A0ABV8TTS9_9ACTN
MPTDAVRVRPGHGELRPRPHGPRRPHGARGKRSVHPAAWWGWAIALATVTALSHNPWTNLLIVAVTGLVVAACRGDEPWSGAWRVFLAIGLTVVGIRFVFYFLFGGTEGTTVLFTLPQWNIGDTGLSVGGRVTAEGALAALYDGLRLATLLICVGAANALASPRRLLRSLPTALYEIALAVVVALALIPQLVSAVKRIRRAKELRGSRKKGPIVFMRTVLAPVLTDALDRSLDLAASMASRGYGRATAVDPRNRRTVAGLSMIALTGILVGAYGLLTYESALWTWGMLFAGAAVGVTAVRAASRRFRHTRYRRDRFRPVDWAVLASGAVALAGGIANNVISPSQMWPTPELAPPPLALIAVLGVLTAAAPAFFASEESR